MQYKTIEVQEGQTLANIAVQEYGCVEGMMQLVQVNNLSLNTALYRGMVLQVQATIPKITNDNREKARLFAAANLSFNSGIIETAPPVNGYVQAGYVTTGYVK